MMNRITLAVCFLLLGSIQVGSTLDYEVNEEVFHLFVAHFDVHIANICITNIVLFVWWEVSQQLNF